GGGGGGAPPRGRRRRGRGGRGRRRGTGAARGAGEVPGGRLRIGARAGRSGAPAAARGGGRRRRGGGTPFAHGRAGPASLPRHLMAEPLHVLLVAGAEDDAPPVLRALRQAGYAPKVALAATDAALADALRHRPWDVALLVPGARGPRALDRRLD